MNAEKWHHSEILISINDESQCSTAKNLRCDELLYYTVITHSADVRIFKIGENLAKLRAKSLTSSYTPFALHFRPQRLLIMYGILPRQLVFVAAVVYSGSWDFVIWPM